MFKKKSKAHSGETSENTKENSPDKEKSSKAGSPPPDQENPTAQAMQGATPEIAPDPAKELQSKISEWEDKYLRLRAEFDNYRKRTHKDIAEARFNTKIDTVFPVLSVFDHFRLAVAAAEKTPEFKVLFDGMKLILLEFQKALDDLGIEVIEATGKSFDPNLHEAIGKEASANVEEGKVISQWRCGYMLGDRLLRPSSVIVSSGTEKPAEESPAPYTVDNDQQEDANA